MPQAVRCDSQLLQLKIMRSAGKARLPLCKRDAQQQLLRWAAVRKPGKQSGDPTSARAARSLVTVHDGVVVLARLRGPVDAVQLGHERRDAQAHGRVRQNRGGLGKNHILTPDAEQLRGASVGPEADDRRLRCFEVGCIAGPNKWSAINSTASHGHGSLCRSGATVR